MVRIITVLFFGVLRIGSGTELTPDNWDAAVEGKSVFIKFQAPW